MSETPKPIRTYDAKMASEMADRDDDAIIRGMNGKDRYRDIKLPAESEVKAEVEDKPKTK